MIDHSEFPLRHEPHDYLKIVHMAWFYMLTAISMPLATSEKRGYEANPLVGISYNVDISNNQAFIFIDSKRDKKII